MSEFELQKLESRIAFLRKEADAFRQQSYQQADLLSDLTPALAQLGCAANDDMVDAALRLARGIGENSQDVDSIRLLADAFLKVCRDALASGAAQPHDVVWRMRAADALDAVLPAGSVRSKVATRLREGEPLNLAFEPLAEALDHSALTAGINQRLDDMVSALPLDDTLPVRAQALIDAVNGPGISLAELEEALDEFTTLLEHTLHKLVSRERQMRQLLTHLGRELGLVDQFLGALNRREDDALSSALAVQRAVEDQSRDMVLVFDRSNSLVELREQVDERARAIRQRMDQFAQEARASRERATKETKRLSERLLAMEAELSATREALVEAADSAARDHLTGLYNRKAYEEMMKSWLAKAKHNGELCCIIWDIDHFKHVNDTYGHELGDQVLKATAAVLEAWTEEGDLAARLGGEEFVSVVRGKDRPSLFSWADQVREQVARLEHEADDCRFSISVSCGIATYERGDSLPSITVRADRALYDAKASGRNCCRMAA